MDDLISRQAAIDAIHREADRLESGGAIPHSQGARGMAFVIGLLPSAEPQIVHCRDCKNLEIDSIFHDCWCNGHKVWLDHYCGYAERKNDG